MKETVDKIRALLDELESNDSNEEPSFKQSFHSCPTGLRVEG
jgi:hypothetical protein